MTERVLLLTFVTADGETELCLKLVEGVPHSFTGDDGLRFLRPLLDAGLQEIRVEPWQPKDS